METLLHVGLSNAVLAAGLALVAALVGTVCRRPAVVHCLWLLVLIKLVTPPLVPVPLPTFAAPAPVIHEPPPSPEALVVEAEFALDDEPAPAQPPAEAAVAEPPAAVTSWYWLPALVWLTGSAGWLLMAVWRAGKFRALLRHAEAAPGWLRAEGEYVAERLGLPYCPPIWLVPGRVSPMLWSLGGSTRLFLPSELLDRLTPEARSSLLAHELAHLRRGDHRVRWLELACTVLYWWNPVLWWARHQLREAEEQCCDAWVVWALPRARRSYALALVDTVDFLSEAQPATPALASGVGPIHDLRKRVTMIMRGTTPRDLSWVGGLGVLCLGAVLLPLSGSWADEPEEERDVLIRRDVLVEKDGKPLDPKVRGELDQAKARVEEARARLREAEAQLKRAQDRIAGGAAAGETRKEVRGKMKILIQSADGKVIKEVEIPEGARVVTPDGAVKRSIELELRVPEGRGGPPADRGPGRPVTPPPAAGARGGPADGRIPDLERRLDQLMREMENLRRELRQPRGPAGEGGPGVAPVPPRPPVAPVPPTPPAPPVERRRERESVR